jgi:hypothetical protein
MTSPTPSLPASIREALDEYAAENAISKFGRHTLAARTALEAHLLALVADAARMDWMDEHTAGGPLREAIDKARAESRRPNVLPKSAVLVDRPRCKHCGGLLVTAGRTAAGYCDTRGCPAQSLIVPVIPPHSPPAERESAR